MKKPQSAEVLDMRYEIRSPIGRHKSFRIMKVHESRYETIKHPTLDAVNTSYHTGKLGAEEALKSLKLLVRDLYKEAGQPVLEPVFSKENQGILNKYWAAKYARRALVDKASARSALERAVAILGMLSLASASFEQLQDCVDLHFKGNKQRRIVQSLNQLLKFLNRDFVLNKAKPVHYKVRYLTEPELNKLLPHLPSEPIKLLHQVCFYTGCRIGEAFAIEASHIKGNKLRVLEQLDKQGQTRETKNGKVRTAYIFPEAIPVIKRWILAKGAIDAPTRSRMAKITKSACRRAFPGNESKWCKFHDMRHSYAIALISKGVSLTAVAQCLGNSTAVCEKHYIGHELTDETIETIQKILAK
jgi:integrase